MYDIEVKIPEPAPNTFVQKPPNEKIITGYYKRTPNIIVIKKYLNTVAFGMIDLCQPYNFFMCKRFL